jgi:ACS family tartrate transporter-like MFS transporter
MTAAPNATLYRRIAVRVAPMLIVLYFVAFLDRVNISFAALTMNRDLGINDASYGLAAGIFFAGYLVFAVPANLALVRFGARRWIGVLVATWGLFSMSMAFVHNVPQFVGLRFLVGAAEAGFYPGVIFYLTQWLPSRSRAGIMAAFTFAIPLSSVIGSPISAWILRTHWSGALAGWQWLFLLEGIPAVLLGCLTPFLLASGPQEVSWLSGEEKRTLALAMEQDEASRGFEASAAKCASFSSLILPTLTYFALMNGLYALGFWVPKILTRLGVPLTQIGWLTAVPFAVGGAGMLIWSRWSDNKQERRLNLSLALFSAGSGMVITGLAPAMPIFWAGFSQCITQRQAAVSIAIVNNVGQLAGFFGPYTMGLLLQRTHHFAPGLAVTAGCLFSGVVLVLCNRQLRASTAVH